MNLKSTNHKMQNTKRKMPASYSPEAKPMAGGQNNN